MKTKAKVKRLHTTLGDLIVAITDAALEVSRNERAAYCLTGRVMDRMLAPVPVTARRRGTILRRKD